MKLWVRLAVLMAVVALVPLALAGFRAVQISTRAAESNALVGLERDAARLATLLETWTEEQASALQGWMRLYPDLIDKSAPQQEGLLRAAFVAVPSVVTLVLTDGDGVSLVPAVFLSEPTDDGTMAGRAVGSEAGAKALQSRLPISELVEQWAEELDRSQEDLGYRAQPFMAAWGSAYQVPTRLDASAPLAVTGPAGARLVLGAEIDVGRVMERLLRSEGGTGREVLVLSRDGTNVWSTPGAPPNVDGLRPLLGTGASFQDERYAMHGGIATVSGTDWSVVVLEPSVMSERAAARIRRQNLQVVGVAVVLAILFGIVIARTVSEPIGSLRDSALAVADGDYGRRVRVDTSDEVGELAAAFNHMSERLEASRSEIQEQQREIELFNLELQERVEERTRELREAQAQLVQSGQLAAVAEIGAGLAHELNNPLTGILGLTQVLRARSPDEALLNRIEEQAERCREVVAAMLRVSETRLDPDDAPVVEVGEVLRDVMGLVGGTIRQRGVSLTLVEPVEALRIRMDPVLAARVLAQLLTTLTAGLTAGCTLSVSARLLPLGEGQKSRSVAVYLKPSEPVAAGAARDDFMAAGLGLWVARKLLDQVGGRLEQPSRDDAWRVVLPGA